ncbi:MAG: prolipoprotein diacylglyceryl transferase [Chamaesiphon sp.]|nr:prolipoprotein diacylglyceryl transferase [Chamaesiphon sp.]
MLINDLFSTIQFPYLDFTALSAGSYTNLARSLLAFEFVSPGEEIFHLGWFRLKWYGLLIATAVLIGVNLSIRLGQSRKIDPEAIADLAIWLVIGAIPAARLYYVIFEWDTYSQYPQNIIKIWEGGIAIHGALIGGSIAAIIFAKLKQISFWQLADVIAPSVVLGQAIGRWGNFFNSEAFGSQTDLPWKLCIPISPNGCEYVHPTFLYESIWNLVVFTLLMWLFIKDSRQHHLKTGSIFLVYLVAYSIGRFWIEGLRTDSLMFGSLRMAQMISLVGIAIGSIGLSWLYLRRRSLPDVV